MKYLVIIKNLLNVLKENFLKKVFMCVQIKVMEETGNIWGEKCSGRQAAFCENSMVSYNERSG